MTNSDANKILEEKLLTSITDENPMLSMLQWITEKFIEIEVVVESKIILIVVWWLNHSRDLWDF